MLILASTRLETVRGWLENVYSKATGGVFFDFFRPFSQKIAPHFDIKKEQNLWIFSLFLRILTPFLAKIGKNG